MKRRKLLLSTLAAAVFATSAGALVACGDGVELPTGGVQPGNTPTDTSYTITFVPGADAQLTKIQGNSLTTNKDGKLEGTMPEAEKKENKDDYTFLGWGLAAGQTVPTITSNTFNNHKFDASISVYAVFKENDTPTPPGPIVTDEYDITFLAGENGTLSGETSVKTENGKVKTFPTVTANDGWEWTGWKDADGNQVTSYTTFTKSTSVTAQYVEKVTPGPGPTLEATGNDVYADGTLLTNLEQVTPNKQEFPTREKEWAAYNITFTTGQVLTFTVENNANVQMWLDGGSSDTLELTQGTPNTITVKLGGVYQVTVCQYDNQVANGEYCVWIGVPGEPGPGPIDPPQGDRNLYLKGGMNNWGDGIKLTEIDADTANNMKEQYSVEFTTTEADQEIKVWEDDNTDDGAWIGFDQAFLAGTPDVALPVEENGNLKVPTVGTYIAYIKVYNDGWVRVDLVKQGGDIPNPPPGPTTEVAKVNDTTMTDNTANISHENEQGEPINETMTKEYMLKDMALSKDDTVSFKINGTAVEVWLEKKENVAISGANTRATSFTITKDGTYDFYLQYYTDGGADQQGGWRVWVEGTTSTEPTPPPGPTTEVAKVNDTTMTDNTANISHENEQGEPINETMTKEYMLKDMALSKDDTVSFKINGTAVEVWLEKKENVAISGANTRATSFTITKDGTYDFYLQYYTDGGADQQGGWRVWVEGTTETEPTPPPQPGESKFYLYGTVGGDNKWSAEKGYEFGEIDPDANETLAKKYKVEVPLAVGDQVKIFKTNDQENEWSFNNVEEGCLGENIDWKGSNLEALKAGTFTFYLKIGTDGGSSVWINFAASEQPGPSPEDPDDLDVGQYIKVGDEFTKLTAGTPDATKNEAEYYNVKLELTKTTTIKLWAQNATGGAVRNINALKINGVEKFGYNQYGQTGTDHYDLEAGNYEIHYKVYKDGWVELDISKEIEIGDAIVISAADAGKCATITVNGQSIKLYIKEGDNIVDLANNSTFRIYAWSGIATAGYPGTVITSEMTLTGTLSNVKFLINKGGDSSKTADLSGISGNVWVITYAVGGGSVAPGVVQA